MTIKVTSRLEDISLGVFEEMFERSEHLLKVPVFNTVFIHKCVNVCICLFWVCVSETTNHGAIVENYDTSSICYAESVLSSHKGATDAVS